LALEDNLHLLTLREKMPLTDRLPIPLGCLSSKMVEVAGMPQTFASEHKSSRNPLILKVKMSDSTKFPQGILSP